MLSKDIFILADYAFSTLEMIFSFNGPSPLFAGTELYCLIKLKFHWDQFPRNFLADLLATSPTSP